jgi:ribosomal protein S24E
MGMFDDIHVEKLKVSAPRAVMQFLQLHGAAMPCDFQTKDLDCIMAHYTILANGQMMVDAYVDTGKTEPYVPISMTDNRSFLERLYFDLKFPRSKTPMRKKVLKKVLKKVDFTKTFVMYGGEQIAGRHLSIEYTVTVIKGKVKSIVYLKHELESEKAAKTRNALDAQFTLKMDASINAHRLLRSRWYYPLLKEILNPAIFFAKLFIQKICGKVLHCSSHWHGV